MITNYIKVLEDGTQVSTKDEPVYGLGNTRTVSGYNPDVYNIEEKKWYNSTNGNELVTNGTFDVDTTGWSNAEVTLSIENGRLKAVRNSGTGNHPIQTIATEIGKEYTFICTINPQNSGNGIRLTNGTTIAYQWTNIAGATEHINFSFTAQYTSYDITLLIDTIGQIMYIDDVSVFETEIEPDTAYTQGLTYLPYEVTVANGQVVDVDSKIFPTLVEDYVKAKVVDGEHKGKNSCVGRCVANGQDTPVTLGNTAYNIDKIIRNGTGLYEVKFINKVKLGYSVLTDGNQDNTAQFGHFVNAYNLREDGFNIVCGQTYQSSSSGYRNTKVINLTIMGEYV